jgi:hypothetical protein
MISQSDLLNYLCSVANRGAAYLAGTSRSVGRGWPPKATSYPEFSHRNARHWTIISILMWNILNQHSGNFKKENGG